MLEVHAVRADLHRETLALLFIGLDGFKTVNDSFGRRVGDLLLQETAGRLRATCDDALIARAGGDEFVMLIAAPSGGSDAAFASQRLLAAFATRLAGLTYEVPADDLRISLRRIPARVADGMTILPVGTPAELAPAAVDRPVRRPAAGWP